MNKHLLSFPLLLLATFLFAGRSIAQLCAPITSDICNTCASFTGPTPSSIPAWCPGDLYTVNCSINAPFPYTIKDYWWSPSVGSTTLTPGTGGATNFTSVIAGPYYPTTYTLNADIYGPNLINNGAFNGCGYGPTDYPCFSTQYQDATGPTGNMHGHVRMGSFYSAQIPPPSATPNCLDPAINASPYNYTLDVITHNDIGCNAPGGYSNLLAVKGRSFGSGVATYNLLLGWLNSQTAISDKPGYFWGQNVVLCPGATYEFTYWVKEMEPCPDATTVPTINIAFARGTSPAMFDPCPSIATGAQGSWGFTPVILDSYTPPFPTNGTCNDLWYKHTLVFTYPPVAPAGPVFICMTDENLSTTGNAFGIDDISLNRVCTVPATNITITPPESAPTILPGPNSICINQPYTFTISGVNGHIVQYVIRSGSSIITSATSTIAGGVINVTVTPTNCLPLTLEITQVTIPSCAPFATSIVSAPLAVDNPGTITGPSYICGTGPSNAITMSNAAACGTGATSWTGTNSIISISSGGVVTGLSRGSALVTFTKGNCSVTKMITVYAPKPFIDDDYPKPIGCTGAGFNIRFYGIPGDKIYYQIKDPGATSFGMAASVTLTGSVFNVPYTPMLPGTLTVKIIKIIQGPCTFAPLSYTYTKPIEMTPVPGVISGANPLCGMYASTLNYPALYPAAYLTFTGVPASGGVWTSSVPSVASINSSTGKIVSADVTTTQTTVISYSFSNSCGSVSDSRIQKVTPTPRASVEITTPCPGPAPATVGFACPGSPAYFTIKAPANTSVRYYTYSPTGVSSPSTWISMGSTTSQVVGPFPSPVTLSILTIRDDVTLCTKDILTSWFLAPYPVYYKATVYDAGTAGGIYGSSTMNVCNGEPYRIAVWMSGIKPGVVKLKDMSTGIVYPISITDVSGLGYSPWFTATTPTTFCIVSISNCCTYTAPDPHISIPCVTVNVLPKPTIALTNTAPNCNSFTLLQSGSPCTSFVWSGPGIPSSPPYTTPGTTHSLFVSSVPMPGGTYAITGTAANGCKATATRTVPIGTPLSLTATLEYIPSSLCVSKPGYAAIKIRGIAGSTIHLSPTGTTVTLNTSSSSPSGMPITQTFPIPFTPSAINTTFTISSMTHPWMSSCPTATPASCVVVAAPKVSGCMEYVSSTSSRIYATPGATANYLVWATGPSGSAMLLLHHLSTSTAPWPVPVPPGYSYITGAMLTTITSPTGCIFTPTCPFAGRFADAPMTLSYPEHICQNTAATITAKYVDNSKDARYQWCKYVPDNSKETIEMIPGATSSSYTATFNEGDALFLVKAENGSMTMSDTLIVRFSTPAVKAMYSASSDVPGEINLYVDKAKQSYTYQWSGGNAKCRDAACGTATDNPLAVTTYTVVATDPSDCKSSDVITVVPGSKDQNITAAGKITEGQTSISIHPNPNKGVFTLSGSLSDIADMGEVTVQILDMLGKVILAEKVTVKKGMINHDFSLPDNVANGIYLINVKSGDANQVLRFSLSR